MVDSQKERECKRHIVTDHRTACQIASPPAGGFSFGGSPELVGYCALSDLLIYD